VDGRASITARTKRRLNGILDRTFPVPDNEKMKSEIKSKQNALPDTKLAT
jgi:hypothetical protein